MAISEQVRAAGGPADTAWYALSAEEVAARLGVDPATGLSAARAAELLAASGPNALPVEPPPSPLRRFLAEYTSYMQLILVGASIISLVIQEWSTAIVLIVITLFNALVGLRQAGKAQSAMNALKSMMKATARVRRDGTEAEIPAEQVVVGDAALIAAGDEVPADGRIVTSSALEIDESALTGESVPGEDHPSGRQDEYHRRRDPALRRGERREARQRQGGRRSDRGRAARAGAQGGPVHRRDA